MKKFTFIVSLIITLVLASCSQTPKANLKTDIDSLSFFTGVARTEGLADYLNSLGIDSAQMGKFLSGFTAGSNAITSKDNAYKIGYQIGMQVSNSWVDGLNKELFKDDNTQTISRDNMLAGFVQGVKVMKNSARLAEANRIMQTKMEAVRTKSLEKQYASYKDSCQQFLADNKGKEGVVTTESGLQYKVITEGKGEIPTDTSRVIVNYKGSLINGTEFDSSYKRGEPAKFRANQVIKGWTEALKLMPVGSKWELYIPYQLGYGHQDMGKIKPFSTLIFEVELLGIDNKKK